MRVLAAPRLAAASGLDAQTRDDSSEWLSALAGAYGANDQASLLSVLSPGLSFALTVGLIPPNAREVAAFAQEWLLLRYGEGRLYDAALALGQSSYFVFLPDYVPNTFAVGLQVYMSQPLLRVMSRGEVGRTPDERPLFLSFGSDETAIAILPLEDYEPSVEARFYASREGIVLPETRGVTAGRIIHRENPARGGDSSVDAAGSHDGADVESEGASLLGHQ